MKIKELNNLINDMVRYELGDMEEKLVLQFYCDLANSGSLKKLQGHYHRNFAYLIALELIHFDEGLNIYEPTT